MSVIQVNPMALRAKSAAAFLDIGVSTFWKWVKDGRLPKGKRLSARTTVWLRQDLEKFLSDVAESHGDTA